MVERAVRDETERKSLVAISPFFFYLKIICIPFYPLYTVLSPEAKHKL